MKYLPGSLNTLGLDLGGNNLTENSENLMLLGKGMKQISNNLETLVLNLYNNNLGNNFESI